MADPIPIPTRLAARPRDDRDRPIPWFVGTYDGKPDFRIANAARLTEALRFRKCWLCGGFLGRHVAFAIGPMCAVNRMTAEPGSHLTCALYAARACPFLAHPNMRRRPVDERPDLGPPPGIPLARNPGMVAIWITERWKVVRAPGGPMISLGDPTEVLWYIAGHPATPEQARVAFDAGVPLLRQACELDTDPDASRAQLAQLIRAAHRLLPAEKVTAP